MRLRATERSAAQPAAETASAFPRPALATEYVVSATQTEIALAKIWRGVLGLEQVGTQDNFFDLGGDSVIGIQIVARAATQGLQFSPEQLFHHQTIAGLAGWLDGAGPSPEIPAAAEPAEPDVPPTAGGFDADLSADELDKIFSQLE